jgi:hypothetical protein
MQEIFSSALTILLRVGLPLLILAGLLVACVAISRRQAWPQRYHGGQLVGSGLYWNLWTLGFVTISEPTGVLPGSSTQRYAPVPIPILLIAGPLLGLTFVTFLPAIAVAFCCWLVGKQVLAHLRPPRQAAVQSQKHKTAPL